MAVAEKADPLTPEILIEKNEEDSLLVRGATEDKVYDSPNSEALTTSADSTAKQKLNSNRRQDRRNWSCVVGCAIAHFVLGGFERSNGILYLHIQEKFGRNASDIAWVLSLSVTFKLLFGPVASVLCTRFTPRLVVITGTVLCAIGILVSAFVPYFFLLYLSYGVLAGIGKSLAYQPGLVVVGQHFEKRRSIAVGLATAGGGVGTLLLPPLFEMVLENYCFAGGLMIISAISLHMCISGMLYKTAPPKGRLKRDSFISHSCERFHDNRLLQGSEGSDLSTSTSCERKKQKLFHKLWISKCLKSCSQKCKTKDSSQKRIDLSLLKRPDFVMFCVGICFLALSFNSMLVFIPPLVGSRGLTRLQGAYVMSVAGVFDTVGRISSGFILNIKRLRNVRKVLYNIVMFLLSFVIFFLPFTVTFFEFCVVAAVFGLLIGTYTSQKSVILVDVVGSEALNSSFGILIFFQGVGTLLGPPITGVFKDFLNSYADGFFFLGSTTFVGAVILLFSNFVKCTKKTEHTEVDI